MNAAGGYSMSLVCTDRGLLIASAGETVRSEAIAGLTSLFDDIVVRAVRDLGLADIEEFTLADARVGTLVVRPIDARPQPEAVPRRAGAAAPRVAQEHQHRRSQPVGGPPSAARYNH
jgi:hypothetical protein